MPGATVRSTGRGKTAKQTIWVNGHPIFSETEYYKAIGPGDTPGPIMLLRFSGDRRWLFFTVDPGGSASIAADGLVLRVISVRGGRVHELGPMLTALWQIGFDGSERRLTAPPAGSADETPKFAGNTLLFVRTTKLHGTLYALHNGRLAGPFVWLGFSLGYYGHHSWAYTPR